MQPEIYKILVSSVKSDEEEIDIGLNSNIFFYKGLRNAALINFRIAKNKISYSLIFNGMCRLFQLTLVN